MLESRTEAERYLANRKSDPEYTESYNTARCRIDCIDRIIRSIDQHRLNMQISKAELARRSGLRPEVVRRLFSNQRPNPTLTTLVALTTALGLELFPEPAVTAPINNTSLVE